MYEAINQLTKGDYHMAEEKVHRASFSLEPEYIALLDQIAKKQRSNKTVELRRMIDAAALALGLTPIAPDAVPNFFALFQKAPALK